MADIPILEGVYAGAQSDFLRSMPVNREPILLESGISQGFLRPYPGIVEFGQGPGADRGGIEWGGVMYRVMGTSFVSVASDGAVTVIGDVGAGGVCAFDYSFERLAINSGTRLYYYTPDTSLPHPGLVQVTDPDLGPVLDVVWLDGYFITTDGEFILTSDLNDPFSWDPLHYGSSELDPDPIVALAKIRGELYAINSNTIQVFRNIGGLGFPFQVIDGADIPRGGCGSRARVLYRETIAFVGGGRNEPVGVYLVGAGTSTKISTREVDIELGKLTLEQQALVYLENIFYGDEARLVVHTPQTSMVFYFSVSLADKQRLWGIIGKGVLGTDPYTARSAIYAYGIIIVGDPAGRLGRMTRAVCTQWGEITGWRFDTGLLYQQRRRGIINTVSLVGLLGEAPFGADPVVFFSYTIDGRTWSQERAVSAGVSGDRGINIQWRPGIRFNTWAGLRFRGADAGMATYAALNLDIEALAA